ncbi:hypothetical protein AMTRI_Chr02g266040 [Amborella trichopoda]
MDPRKNHLKYTSFRSSIPGRATHIPAPNRQLLRQLVCTSTADVYIHPSPAQLIRASARWDVNKSRKKRPEFYGRDSAGKPKISSITPELWCTGRLPLTTSMSSVDCHVPVSGGVTEATATMRPGHFRYPRRLERAPLKGTDDHHHPTVIPTISGRSIGNADEVLLEVENRIKHVRPRVKGKEVVGFMEKIKSFSIEKKEMCCICQEDLQGEDEMGRLQCGHGYHLSCIRRWLLHKCACPICKAHASFAKASHPSHFP